MKIQEQIKMKNVIRLVFSKQWESKVLMLILICLLINPFLFAQKYTPFKSGEQLKFDIYFKYGIVMAKAGTAQYDVKSSPYFNQSDIKTILTFKTTSTFDKIFKVRDTLNSYLNEDLEPIYHKKYLHEGKTNYTEEITYKQHNNNFSKVRSIRATPEQVKFDTILSCKSLGYDMLSIFVFARTLDFSNLYTGKAFPLATFVGRDVVKMNIRYVGQAILEKNETQKYKTHRFEVDIIDETFEGSKSAMEIWISDDENRIPVKIRAKLKIGAAEAELSSYKNIKYPFTSLVTLKSR